MSKEEVLPSDIYLQEEVILELDKKYLLLAQSGDGKTSLLNILFGSNRNFNGNIQFPWDSPLDIPFIRRERLSYVFQDLKLFPALTAMENIQLKNGLTNFKSVKEIDEMLDRVQLGHKAHTPVASLSLGQRQRVAVIRALCQPFQLLLLDEPFSHLDDKNTEILAELISESLEKQKAGLLMTSLSPTKVFAFDHTFKLSL